MSIKNTTDEADKDPMRTLARLMFQANPIERQEAQGQRELVHSALLPVDGSDHPDMQAMGIEWGEPANGDPLFRHAKLPAGWSKRATDHSMWSEIVDETGKKRASIFYKAAFYDRRADIHAER